MKIYKQIKLEEREKIYQLLKADISLRKIAKKLGRSKSSISREVKRNSSIKLGYLPDRANIAASKRKNKAPCKIEKYQDLKQYILDKLVEDKWSPEIIAGRIKMEKHLPSISHESIYKYIYSYDGQKLKLYESLMYARPKRQLKFSRRKRTVPEVYKDT
jgi:IS30 family transposase